MLFLVSLEALKGVSASLAEHMKPLILSVHVPAAGQVLSKVFCRDSKAIEGLLWLVL